MSEKEYTSDSSSSESSASEGEYLVDADEGAVTPKFDFSGWNPDSASGIQYLGLLPVEYPQQSPTGKVKARTLLRRNRQKHSLTYNAIPRNIIDEKKLRQAVNKDDFERVRLLLEEGVDASCVDEKKRSALHIAASKGNAEIVRLLLEFGANPNLKDSIGNTPLHLAACTAHIQVITLLLRAGTNVHSLDHSGRSPLHLARSRLQRLKLDSPFTSYQLKMEVIQVIEMMKTYLALAGQDSDAYELESITNRLASTTTREEVDEINHLLQDFTNLTIEKDLKPG